MRIELISKSRNLLSVILHHSSHPWARPSQNVIASVFRLGFSAHSFTGHFIRNAVGMPMTRRIGVPSIVPTVFSDLDTVKPSLDYSIAVWQCYSILTTTRRKHDTLTKTFRHLPKVCAVRVFVDKEQMCDTGTFAKCHAIKYWNFWHRIEVGVRARICGSANGYYQCLRCTTESFYNQ